jgi:hypothetical protein
MADLVLQVLSVSVPARSLSATVPALLALTVPVPVLLLVQDGVAPVQVPQFVAALVVVSGHYPSASRDSARLLPDWIV